MTAKENGQDKIEKICELLKSQALEPAEKKSQQIIAEAEKKAKEIIHGAEKKVESLLKEASAKISYEQKAAHVALREAHKQTIESLKQDIEKKMFQEALHTLVVQNSNQPEPLAHLIQSLVTAVEKEGLSADFSAVVSREVDVSAVNSLLVKNIIEKLEGKSVQIGPLAGGLLLSLRDKKLTFDVSSQALEEVLAKHLRKDFRDKIFMKPS